MYEYIFIVVYCDILHLRFSSHSSYYHYYYKYYHVEMLVEAFILFLVFALQNNLSS